MGGPDILATMDEGYTEYEVDQWVDAITQLHVHEVHADIAREVGHEIGMLMSEYGFQGAPMHVLRMMSNAMEIGYARAIYDVQDGKYDRDIRNWRPELNE